MMTHIVVFGHGGFDPDVRPSRVQLLDHQYVRFYSGPGAVIDGPAANILAQLIAQDPDSTWWHRHVKGRFIFAGNYSEEVKLQSSSQKRRNDSAKVDQNTARYPKTYNPSQGYLNLLIGPTSRSLVRNYTYSLKKREDDEESFAPKIVAITKYQVGEGEKKVFNVEYRLLSTLPREGTLKRLLEECEKLFGPNPFMIHWVACTEIDEDDEEALDFKYLNYVWEVK
jgi:hypothetical protein